MKEIMKNYGAAILAAVMAAAVLSLIFSGALFRGQGTASLPSLNLSEKSAGIGALGEASVKTVRSRGGIDAADVVSAVHLTSGEALPVDSLVKSLSGKAYSVRVRRVELCSGADAGRDVTGDALAPDGASLTFPKSGAYRVSLVLSDTDGAYMNGSMYYAIEPAGPLLA